MKMCRVLIISVINLSLSEVSFQLLEMTCIKEIQNQSSSVSSTGSSYILFAIFGWILKAFMRRLTYKNVFETSSCLR